MIGAVISCLVRGTGASSGAVTTRPLRIHPGAGARIDSALPIMRVERDRAPRDRQRDMIVCRYTRARRTGRFGGRTSLAGREVARLTRRVADRARVVRTLATVSGAEVGVREPGTGASGEQANGDHYRNQKPLDHVCSLCSRASSGRSVRSASADPKSRQSRQNSSKLYFYT